jgi:hypothetical protein
VILNNAACRSEGNLRIARKVQFSIKEKIRVFGVSLIGCFEAVGFRTAIPVRDSPECFSGIASFGEI